MPAKVHVGPGYQGTTRYIPRGRDYEERRDFEPPITDPVLRDIERRLAALEQRGESHGRVPRN